MRLFDNIIFVFVQIVLIIYLGLINAQIIKHTTQNKNKTIGALQLLLVDSFSLLVIYESYTGLQSGTANVDLSEMWSQVIIAIMLVSGLAFGLHSSRGVATQLIKNDRENLVATLLSNGFVIIVLMAIAFSVEWNLKWIL